jgi:hypothetical protein
MNIFSLNSCLNFIEEILRGLSMQEVKDVFELIEEVNEIREKSTDKE